MREMSVEMNVMELIGQADPLLGSGQSEQAIGLYRAWLEANPEHVQRHFALYNLGVILLNRNELPEARQAFEESIRLQPDFYPPYINLGNAMERLGFPGEATACWRALAERLPMLTGENIGYKTSALKQIARVQGMAEAEEALRQSLEIDPRQHEVMEHWINWRQVQCIWPVMVPFGPCDRTHLMKGFAPLSLAVFTDDPLFQLANAAQYHRSEIGQPQPVYLDAHRALRSDPPSRLRVGYLSSDLRIHAIGYLMAEIFELHDRQQVEVFVYAIGTAFEDPMKQRIQGAVEHWRDLHGLGDAEAAQRIIADRIEILVDVNGYTHSARTKMLAMRPAPVIVNWLGYPGTMGSPYHHYLIADPFVVPESLEYCYSERVVRLPCYQPNDRKRLVDGHRPDRREAGLPEGVMVYGCFNGVKKITALTWHLWMRVLEQVPASVLWLLHDNDVAQERLVAMAGMRGIAPERVIFAPRLTNHQHMARYPLVDLMLDSTPYGAHTTASDALWMGVPILTMAGLSFAARVCGSLVQAAGLGELICATPDEFVNRAVELGTNRPLLDSYRKRLEEGRDRCVLFDTPLLVSRLEGLYHGMRADFQQDRLPRPDLSNLEIYQEVGIELDRNDGVWFGTVEALEMAYLDQLTERDRLSMIPEDGRLWSPEARKRHARRRLTLLDTLAERDDAGDLEGLIDAARDPQHDPTELMLLVAQGIDRGRMRVSYIVAMLLANAGYRHPVIAVALAVGGVLFGNDSEWERGSAELVPLFQEVSAEQRANLIARVVTPAMRHVEGGGAAGVDPERVARLMTLLGEVRTLEG
ncbi:MAG: tetratricopeptide repeat protein [Magnetococcales bacterium]|nr:tetratricopeptide repeat protein [Magnetococcales bacterium]